ncbi:DNA topoisomerase 1 [Erysiphe neolycopersici]|uniref:DNA topoisomerase I n=1 Tax=Erysiphe neolycopersici TaxID=212602 RepID=A0A420I036_9PEZI|nr:DNA topoisomerase 1 [Erysiphe neolycopersici]
MSDMSEDDSSLTKKRVRKSATSAKEKGTSKAIAKKTSPYSIDNATPAGLTIRNGPVLEDNEKNKVIGTSSSPTKRKSRSSMSKSINYNEDVDEDEESEEAPLAKRQRKSKKTIDNTNHSSPASNRKGKLPPKTDMGDFASSGDEEPLTQKIAKKKASIEKSAVKEAQKARSKDNNTKARKAIKTEANSKSNNKKSNATPKKNGSTTSKSKQVKEEEKPDLNKSKKEAKSSEEAEEVYKWWLEEKDDDSIKWTTLQHNGVVFPPEYEPLPKNVKLIYDGVPVTLSVEAEEIAGFFGAMLNSTLNVENPVFQNNFFEDFVEEVEKTGGARGPNREKINIKEFSKLDFKQIFAYYDGRSQERKAKSPAEKKADKAAKEALESPFTHCIWDGRKEQVGNFRIEPPGLFRGRGAHPKTGKVKRRVVPEQITINIGKEAIVPAPPPGHKWKSIQHDNKATWLAMWQENINGAYKYVMLAAKSSIKGQSDYKKFEKARELKKHIDRIRKDYTKDLHSELMADRQRATAVYLIDKFALRAGNEKDTENEAETVGCCSLKYEHITLKPPNIVIFDFLGKDSIRYYDEVTVDPQVFKNLKLFKRPPKSDGDDIFDRLNTTQLNKHLTNYMPGLSAKVFRTYNASFTMSTLLKELKNTNISVQEKVKLYNDCNRKVAILCNHKRTVGASHEAQMEKMTDRIKALQYQQWRLKQMILAIEPSQKKKMGAKWFELHEELDVAWILDHQAFLVEEMRAKIEKKFQKENEKLLADGQKEMKDKELEERLEAAKALNSKFKKENQTKKIEVEGKNLTVEKIVANISKLDERIANMRLQAEDREGNKEVALGTSKINYIDPRLTAVFAKKFGVPIEKFFSKTLREKFVWAIDSIDDDDNWEF